MTVTPRALRCESLDEPLGVGTSTPRLSWKLASEVRGAFQAAFRARLGAWDTGWVTSEEQAVEYGGAPLVSSSHYAWEVSVRDASGAVASASSSFGTGILHRDEWRAAWIGRDRLAPGGVDVPQNRDRTSRTEHLLPPLGLRRSFSLERVPERARVHVSARGLYRLHVNGVRVGVDELTPGWTDYRDRIQYQTYDVTGLLVPGSNVLEATVADGWWCGFVGFDARRHAMHYGTEPQFLAQLVLDHPGGGRELVVTDGSWEECPGPIQYADLLMGEQVDARVTPAVWHPVAVLDHDVSVLAPTLDEPVRVTAELPARSVVVRPEGHLVDFGQNLVGRVRLSLRGAAAGQRVAIRYGELLDDDGGLYTENLRSAEATDVYYAAGLDAEEFEPRFTTHGFRYALVEGHEGLAAADVTGVVLHSDTEFVGTFDCDDPLVNQLQANIVWGQRGNFVSVPTDCPQRDERLGWLGDAHIFAQTACYNADSSAFYSRWMLDVLSAQTALGGAFPDIAPLVTEALRNPGAPAWGDCGVLLPWVLWRNYGDLGILERCFDGMRSWVDYIHGHNPGLLWVNRRGNDYGDWLQVDASTPRDVVATAYFARSARTVARAAEVLGHPSAAHYSELADRIAAAFCDAYVSGDGRVHGDTQTAHLFALAFDLLPAHLVEPVFSRLCTLIEERGARLTTGFLGVALLAPVLADGGRPDLAHALLGQTEYPSWGYSIENGATTIWERWDGWTRERGAQDAAMNSFNHYSLGSIGEWLYSGLAGLAQAPDSSAWRDLIIHPHPGGRITRAAASYDSVRGLIKTSWTRSAAEFRLDIDLPPGTTATVHIPTSAPADVLESGEPPTDVIHLGKETLVCRIRSGRYTFTAPA